VAFAQKTNPLELFLAEELIQQFPEAITLYEELQAIATLPYSYGSQSNSSVLSAWMMFSRIQKESRQLAEQTQILRDKFEKLQLEKKEYLQLQIDNQQENELLISQLHKTQEELEQYFLKNQKLKNIEKN